MAPMAIMKFTEASIRRLPTPPGQQLADYRDRNDPRLGLRVSYTGSKTFVAHLRINGCRRKPTLGRYPSLSLKAARRELQQKVQQLTEDENNTNEESPTFSRLANDYLEKHAKRHKKSWREDQRMLQRTIIPAFTGKLACEIRRRDVRQLLESIYDRGAHTAANRHRALLSVVFNFGIEREYLEANPCIGVPKLHREKPRRRCLSDSELETVFSVLTTRREWFRDFFLLVLFTGQRKKEVLQLPWEELDLPNRVWTLAPSRSKNGQEHRIPLSDPALEILKRRYRNRVGDGVVFPGKTPSLPITNPRKQLVHVNAALSQPFTFHDIRRTVATRLLRIGIAPHLCDKILNHANLPVRIPYHHYGYDEEKREALGALAEHLLEICRPSTESRDKDTQERSPSSIIQQWPLERHTHSFAKSLLDSTA